MARGEFTHTLHTDTLQVKLAVTEPRPHLFPIADYHGWLTQWGPHCGLIDHWARGAGDASQESGIN